MNCFNIAQPRVSEGQPFSKGQPRRSAAIATLTAAGEGLIALFAAFTISSCSDEDSWKYGDKQKLANTAWHGTDYAFMCGGPALTAELTVSLLRGRLRCLGMKPMTI